MIAVLKHDEIRFRDLEAKMTNTLAVTEILFELHTSVMAWMAMAAKCNFTPLNITPNVSAAVVRDPVLVFFELFFEPGEKRDGRDTVET